MRTSGVHRVIEEQAALNGDTPAIVDATRSLSYRELNRRANAVARCLIAHGFRRGGVATVNMPGCPELAIVCLAVLKAGGAYYRCQADGLWRPAESAGCNSPWQSTHHDVSLQPRRQDPHR